MSATALDYPPTIIIRSPRENPRKCSVIPLKGKPGFIFHDYPAQKVDALENYIRLAAEGEELTAADASKGILLLDASWRRSGPMNRQFANVPPRVLRGYQTAYPRRSKQGTDPDNGLASIEALYLAYRVLGRPVEGLLDAYRWRDEFLRLNLLA